MAMWRPVGGLLVKYWSLLLFFLSFVGRKCCRLLPRLFPPLGLEMKKTDESTFSRSVVYFFLCRPAFRGQWYSLFSPLVVWCLLLLPFPYPCTSIYANDSAFFLSLPAGFFRFFFFFPGHQESVAPPGTSGQTAPVGFRFSSFFFFPLCGPEPTTI